MPEPSLSEVHADLVGRFQHDERLRHVEQTQAAQNATMHAMLEKVDALRLDAKADKRELLTAIEASKPKVWPAVSALTGVLVLLSGFFAVLYGN